VECPKCHTVYFLEGGKNADRMYARMHDGQKRWKLLCICSEQIEFRKDEILTFETSKHALNRGRAVVGEWARSKFDLTQLWHVAFASRKPSPLSQLVQLAGKKNVRS